MRLLIVSKSRNDYRLNWYGSINDFICHLSKIEDGYLRCINYFNNSTLLKISEIESISIIEGE